MAVYVRMDESETETRLFCATPPKRQMGALRMKCIEKCGHYSMLAGLLPLAVANSR